MADVVICDTNAVIHLAIICPDVFKASEPIRFVVHTKVRQEIQSLKRDAQLQERLGEIFSFILNEIPHRDCKFPPQDKEVRQHRRIMSMESTLPPGYLSAGSSHADRVFLILAKMNEAILLTNDKTLFNLGAAFLSEERAWRTADAILSIHKAKMIAEEELKQGIQKLSIFGERLTASCVSKLRKIGLM